jgi:hypothetical protein
MILVLAKKGAGFFAETFEIGENGFAFLSIDELGQGTEAEAHVLQDGCGEVFPEGVCQEFEDEGHLLTNHGDAALFGKQLGDFLGGFAESGERTFGMSSEGSELFRISKRSIRGGRARGKGCLLCWGVRVGVGVELASDER